MTYSYDTAHRLASVTDSRGNKTLSYSSSPGGLLNRMTDSEGNRTDYQYDPVGRLTEKWLPNGITSRTRYTRQPHQPNPESER